MQVRIMKATVVCLVAAAILLLIGFTPRRNAKPSAGSSSEARTAPAAANPQPLPNTDGHDLKVLEKALVRRPGHTPVLMNLASLEEGQGRFAEAEKHLRQIVELEPGNFQARLELGRVLFQQGDVQGALSQTQEILKAQPGNPDALYNLGAIYGNLGNAALARQYWERLIAQDPQSESGKRAQRMLPQLASPSR